MGLGGVQKARTRQIDASEIIGKAGSSEQEAPNHPQSSSKLIKYIYIIYIKHIFYIYLYIFMSMLILGMVGTLLLTRSRFTNYFTRIDLPSLCLLNTPQDPFQNYQMDIDI